jgi:hypothetical protein
MTKGPVGAAKKKRGGIPLSALFLTEEAKERVRRDLSNPFSRPAPRVRAELERYLADPLKAATEDMQGLLDQRAPHRQGRRPGAKSKRTPRVEKQFDDLYRDKPERSSEEIRRSVKTPPNIRKMQPGTVANHWTAAKKRTPK